MKTLALIHTVHHVIPSFEEICRRRLPGARTLHLLDESMLRDVIKRGRLDEDVARRVVGLVVRAQEGGADAVLITCSSIGACAALAQPLVCIPVRRVDAPMAAAAVRRGRRIGLAATLSTTLEPTLALLREAMSRAGRRIPIATALFSDAFRARMHGDAARHDAILRDGLARLMRRCSSIVLAQASMASAVGGLSVPAGVKVFASPESGVAQMGRLLRNAH